MDHEEVECWIVDRVEDGIALLLEDGSDVVVQVSAELLGERAVEGAVLSVPVGEVGEPVWERAVRDEEAEAALLDEGRATIERLKDRDPKGDIEL